MAPADPHGRLAFVGGGQMASAIIEGVSRSGAVSPTDIVVHDPAPAARERLATRVPGVRFVEGVAAAAAAAPIVVLAVKPQQAIGVCREIGPALGTDAVLVSIVAGLASRDLAHLAGTSRVVRVMPNTPALVGRGVSVLCRTPDVPDAAARAVRELLATIGHVHEVDESLMDGVTAVSGSGPGFIALLVEAFADGGVKAGLPRPLALALAVQTLAGTAALLETTGQHPAQVKDAVSSPGGTTITGLSVLEQRGVRGAIIDAVIAAAQRSRELGRPPAS